MRKKNIFVVFTIILVGLSIAALPATSVFAGSKTVTLKISNYFPPVIPQSTLLKEFADELTRQSNGRIKIRYFPGGSLLKAPATIKGVESGIADIGLSHIEYTAGRFPVMEACEMPVGYPSPYVANQIMNDFNIKFKPKGFRKFKILWMHANGPAMLLTKKPVRKLEDLKGMIIRAPGRTGDVIRALGGTPAPTPIMETYDALSKGVIDGAFVAYETLKAFKFAEVVKYATNTWFVGPSYPFYVAMNKRSYNKIPADLRIMFNNVAGTYQERYALMWNSVEFPGKKFGKMKGVEFIQLSQAEQRRWIKAVVPVTEKYVSDMKAKGYSENDIRSWFTYIDKRIDFWNKRQKAYQIAFP